jgi:hypothetical protein
LLPFHYLPYAKKGDRGGVSIKGEIYTTTPVNIVKPGHKAIVIYLLIKIYK